MIATEDVWVSPGGKTPASTLYAALLRCIKDLCKSSPSRKAERGKFEAKNFPSGVIDRENKWGFLSKIDVNTRTFMALYIKSFSLAIMLDKFYCVMI
jgi:hypothetical protein